MLFRSLDPVFQVNVFVEVGSRPEIDELNFLVLAADTVDTAKALDDAHRVPVDVVVRQQVAILKICPSEIQSVAMRMSISLSCGMDFIFDRCLARGEKLVSICVNSA